MLAIAVATAEPAKLAEVSWEPAGVALLLLSCLMGVAISFTGFVARREVTATCFTVVGVLNKMLTVLGSVLFSGQHASGIGILSLTVCVTAAACYRQAPLRRTMAARAAVGELTRVDRHSNAERIGHTLTRARYTHTHTHTHTRISNNV